jgi:hypothetical protein
MHAQGREASEPAFEQAPVWPDQADLAVALVRSDAMVAWAGNLQPASARLAAGEQVAVTVDVRLKPGSAAADANRVKVLLHWDRVPQFGGNWPKPKNSPMHLVAENGEVSTYAVTLGSLPPGKYEFAAHVLGANELWARTDTPNETNGRIEILDPRVVSSNGDGPIEGITESTMAHRQPGKIGLSAAVDAGSATGSLD